MVCLLVGYGLVRNFNAPFPEEFSGYSMLYPRLVYNYQLLLHTLNIKDWDVEYLKSVYSEYLKTHKNITLPVQRGEGKDFPYELTPLEEIFPSDPDWEAKLKAKFAAGETVVVRGLMYHDTQHFKDAKKWANIEFFKENVFPNNQEIPVFTDTLVDKSVIMYPFNDYVNDLLHNKTRRWYARCLGDKNKVVDGGFNKTWVTDELMNKAKEAKATSVLNSGVSSDYCLFVGSTQVSTRMHSDTTTSAFLMMSGRKRWVFFPPEMQMYLLPTAHEMNVAYNTRMNIFAPKDVLNREYPFLSLAKGKEVILNQGDVLFFSCFNWHGVQNLDELTIGVDVPIFDPISGFTKNSILTMGTYLNVPALVNLVRGFGKGFVTRTPWMGLKELFFKGYHLSKEEEESVKKREGVKI